MQQKAVMDLDHNGFLIMRNASSKNGDKCAAFSLSAPYGEVGVNCEGRCGAGCNLHIRNATELVWFRQGSIFLQ